VDAQTKALNLWDIENRILALHKELDELHTMKSKLLEKDYPTYSPYLCE